MTHKYKADKNKCAICGAWIGFMQSHAKYCHSCRRKKNKGKLNIWTA